MKVIVVGSGIAGLSLAISLAQAHHHVIVLDSATHLAEVGAGIQMTPQAIRYLFQWGLKDDLVAQSIVPARMHIKDWRDGAVLGSVHIDEMERQYGAPYIVIHRATLHTILHQHATKAGAEVRLNSRVSRYDFNNGAVVLHNNERLEADLVIAADGINSSARAQLLGPADPGSRPTGWAAFRMMADVATIKADPAISHLVDMESLSSHLWIGPSRSCMAYLVKDATMLNIVLSHPDDIDTSDFTLQEYRNVVHDLFNDFEPCVQKLLEISNPNIVNYPVYAIPSLPHWTHDSGRFALIGDASHAMAFYLSMGVSLAVEDAVSLTKALELENLVPALGRGTAQRDNQRALREDVDINALKRAVKTFETVRKRRAEAMQRASLHAGNMIHLPEGTERNTVYETLSRAHEETIASEVVRERIETNTSAEGESDRRLCYGIADTAIRDWCYGYDAVADVVKSHGL